MFDCIGIAVEDANKSVEFYSHFGLKFKSFSDNHFEAITASGTRIMLDTHVLLKEINPNWTKGTNPTTSLGFKMNSTAEVDALFKKIKEFGAIVVKDPFDAFWGQRYASVADPDGNQIDIFGNL
jgi:uncharacterized glyoxalase superfamily protein PhnB